MKKFFLTVVMSLSIAFGMGGLALAASPTQAAQDEVCKGISGAIDGASCGGSGGDVENVVKVVLTILSWIAGIAAVIMVIISGLKYITSGGDSSSVASAKTTLIYALVGVVVVATAQFLVRFVLGKV